MIIRSTDPRSGEMMGEADVCDELIALFIAGTGTIGAALGWACLEIGRDSAVRDQIEWEVDAVLGGCSASADHVRELHYTRRILQEVVRRHSVWLLMRRALVPVNLGGIELPAGSEVYVSPHALHHDSSLYPEPDRFDPDRWLPERCRHLPPGGFIPIGAGDRLCVGEGLAWSEMAIVLSTIVSQWRLDPQPGHRPATRIGTVERLRDLPVTAHRRPAVSRTNGP